MQEDDTNEMRSEYDFSRGVRGKHHAAYHRGANVVRVTKCPSGHSNDRAISNQGPRAVRRRPTGDEK